MDAQIWKAERNLKSLLEHPPVYHFEYISIHNQRIALVRRMDVWHQIALPASIFVFGSLSPVGITQNNWLVLTFGALSASLIVWFVRAYAQSLDRVVVALYPRIVMLELILDYRFYRDYLRNIGEQEKQVVEKCEALEAETTTQLSDEVRKLFKHADFSWNRRRHGILNIAAWSLVIAYWVIVAYVMLFKA